MTTREPLLIKGAIVAAITAGIHVAVVLGWLGISPDQEGAIAGFIDLIGGAVLAFWARTSVTPTADPKLDDGTRLVPEEQYIPEHFDPTTGTVD